MHKNYLKQLSFTLLFSAGALHAQYSTEHYLPPLYTSSSNQSPKDSGFKLHLTTMETSAFTVTVKKSNGNTLTTLSISKTSPGSYAIADGGAHPAYLFADAVGTSDEDKGLYLTSTTKKFYVRLELETENQSQSSTISSKGDKGKGKTFYSAHFLQNGFSGNDKSSFASIMATEDGTTVTIDPKTGVYWNSRGNANSWSQSLDKGESYVLGMTSSEATYDNDIIGTKITADKDIVVNSGTWMGSIGGTSNGEDIGMDQLVPVEKMGEDYFAVSYHDAKNGGNAAIVLATEDNTSVTADGSSVDSDLDEGEFVEVDMDNDEFRYIAANKPVMVWYQGASESNKNGKNNFDFIVLAPVSSDVDDDGYNHAYFSDPEDAISGSKHTWFLMEKSSATTTIKRGNSSVVSPSSFGMTSMGTQSINSATWKYWRIVSQTSDDDIYFSSNGPIHVWYGLGSGTQGHMSSQFPFYASNTAPTATAQTVASPFPLEDVDKTITLAGTDNEGDDLTYTITTLPSNGTLYQTSNGSTRGNAISSTGTQVSDGSHRVIYVSASNGNGDIHGNFAFKVNDGTVDSDAAIVTVNVTAVNDAPVIDQVSDPSAILEDAGEQTINLSGIADGDADVTQSITVTAASSNTILIPNPTVTYTSDNSTGSLAYTPVSNKSGTAVITVTVTDNGGTANSGGDTKTMTFTVTVTAVNDTPTDIGLTSTSVDDDSESGTIVGALSTTDPDIGDSHTYSIVGGNDESKFTISGSNLKITETFDYHVQQSYQVTIRTTDSASATYDETFTIVASNPNNRKPVVTASQSFTIAENQSAGTDVGTVQGSDADNETLQSWTIESGTNKDHYTINSSSGLMEAAKKLDYEDSTERTYSLGIKVSDGNEFSDVVTVAVSVTAVNDETPAVTSNQSFSLDENSSSGESLGTLQATDADVWPSGTSTTFQSWTITSGNDDDDFALESSTGELTTATSLDYETTSAYSLKVTVSDGDNTSSATTVTISVNNVNDKPTITSNPSVTTDEDVEYVFSTSNWNYSDVDNDALSKVKITGLESKGWLYLDANDNDTYDSDEDVTDEHEITTSNISNGHLRFAPVANGNGSAYTTFTFQVRDGTVYNGSDRTMTINVTAVNDKPTTSAQTVSVNEDTDVAITLAGADVDGDNLTYAITTLPSNGTLYQTSDSSTRGDAISSTGTTVSDESHQVIYRSAEHGNGNGHGNFAFKVNDGTVDSDVAAVTVNVAAVNDVPVAAAQTVTVNEDTDVTITLSGTDVEESTLTYKISTLPANGTLYQTADGSTRGDAISEVSTTVTSTEFKVIYVPAENGNGDGHGNFGFKVNDGTVDSDEATVTVNVTAVSDPPVAADEALVIAEDTEITYTLKWVDPDSDESSSLKKTTGSRNSGKKSSRSITRNRITPKNRVVNNLKEDNSSEQTNITKPTAPTTGASFHSINGIVLKIQALPIYGTLKQADNTTISSVPTDVTSDEGKVIYKPKENYVGLDTFKYNAVDADNLVSGLGVISINITGVNDPPIVESIDDIINEDESKTYTLTGSDQEGSDISFKITGLPKQGAITKEDGTIITSVPASLNSNQITYTPDTNFFGRDTVEFQANDGSNNSDDGLITILVNSINDPPVAVRDTINLDEDGTITFSVSGSDIESTDLTYSIQMLQSIGTLYQTSDGETKGTEIKTGDLITNTDQKMIFQGQENGYGVDSLIFKVSDGTDYDSATVVIDIASVPDPPVAQDGDLVIAQALVWDYDVSSKVSDPDGDIDASSLAIVSSIGGGDYRVPVDATLLFVMDYSDNKTYAGIDTVVYQVCDLTELCDTGTIIITVTQGRQPLAISDTLNISEDALPTLINVLSNDSDIDGDMDASTLKLINDPVGEFQGISNFAEAFLNGEIKFSVALNYNGKDSLKYKISDKTRLSGEASVYIFVDPSPDPPEVVSPLTVTIEEDEILEIELYAYDADGDTLTYTLCQEPQNCTIKFPSEDDILSTGDVLAVSATESPTITVTPQLNFTGSDVFTYCVEDEDGNTVIAQVLITVVDIPDPPVALADTISIYQGDIGSINVLSNDTDPENDMDVASLLIYGKDTFPSKSISTYRGGLATVSDSSVMLDYTSFFMFFGSDTLDYSICDIFNTCDTASIYINVVQDDIPPAIFNITTDKDTLVLEEGGIASRGNALATDLTISATVKDSLPLESVLLNVGKGGSEQYTQHQIPFDAGVRMLEIERTVTLETIDEKGIKFYFFASDILGYASNSEVHSLPVKIPPGVISFPECIPSNTWILISIPTQLDDNTIEDVFYNSFGQIDEDKFVVWQYVNGEYVHPTEIVAGLSYWVYQKIGEECDFTIGGGVVTNVDTLKWVLKPGWNLVGNPYPFPFDLGNVDQTLFCGPLEYNEQGGWSGYKTNITPFGGYIICNKADTTVVLTATGGGGGQVSTIFSGGGSKDKTENNGNTAMKRPEKLFRTQISFSTIKYSDNSNFIGIHSQAENDFDRYDNVTEPPVPNNDDKIKFDWVMDKESDRPKYLLQDIRNAGDSTFTWHGYLHPSNSKEEMTVKTNLEGDTDPGYKMVMVDKSHGDQYDLIQKNSFILKLINTSNLGRQFTVFYGPASWVEEEVSELIKTIPTEYHLSQNYPNPFNPVTTINYQIPTDQKVRLSIYNILGQEVKTLINGEQYAGFYTIRWDGTSNSSIKVSSGTYLYIIQTANYRQVKKMVLLK